MSPSSSPRPTWSPTTTKAPVCYLTY
jgi:hypothetical protein